MGNQSSKKPDVKKINPTELQTYIMVVQTKLTQNRNKKVELIKKKRREIASCLEDNNFDIAKAKMESLLREEDLITVFDILGPLCEILKEKVTYLLMSDQCPPDLRAVVDSLVYSSTRLEIEELHKIREMIRMRFGELFVTKANTNADSLVNVNIVDKLKIKPPSDQYLIARLKQLCREDNINYDFPQEIAPMMNIEPFNNFENQFSGNYMPQEFINQYGNYPSQNNVQNMNQNNQPQFNYKDSGFNYQQQSGFSEPQNFSQNPNLGGQNYQSNLSNYESQMGNKSQFNNQNINQFNNQNMNQNQSQFNNQNMNQNQSQFNNMNQNQNLVNNIREQQNQFPQSGLNTGSNINSNKITNVKNINNEDDFFPTPKQSQVKQTGNVQSKQNTNFNVNQSNMPSQQGGGFSNFPTQSVIMHNNNFHQQGQQGQQFQQGQQGQKAKLGETVINTNNTNITPDPQFKNIEDIGSSYNDNSPTIPKIKNNEGVITPNYDINNNTFPSNSGNKNITSQSNFNILDKNESYNPYKDDFNNNNNYNNFPTQSNIHQSSNIAKNSSSVKDKLFSNEENATPKPIDDFEVQDNISQNVNKGQVSDSLMFPKPNQNQYVAESIFPRVSHPGDGQQGDYDDEFPEPKK